MLTKNFTLNQKSISLLSARGLPLALLKSQIDESIDIFLELTYAQGLEIIRKKGLYYFQTKFIPIKDVEFCIVDIEANGSNLDKHQIIEIAAIKVKNGKIIDRYDSLVFTKEINPIITQLTGISASDTVDAPELKTVMMEFKLFLGDAIIVAHDVKFDYTYISESMQKVGFEALLNRSLCSLALAQRTIVSYKYSLTYLNKTFNYNPDATHHRAMSDVMTTYGLFLDSLKSCTENLNNVEDLIKFSKEAKRLKRPKFDPFLEEEMESK
ncbi:MAG: 3'-5' exonuclease [Sulfurimonas sp.]